MYTSFSKITSCISWVFAILASILDSLISLLDLIEAGYKTPSLIIGMPVGFIGVEKSKANIDAVTYLGIG